VSILLRVDDIHVNYGPIRAIRGVSLEVPEGSVVAMVGALAWAGSPAMRGTVALAQEKNDKAVEAVGEGQAGVAKEGGAAAGAGGAAGTDTAAAGPRQSMLGWVFEAEGIFFWPQMGLSIAMVALVVMLIGLMGRCPWCLTSFNDSSSLT